METNVTKPGSKKVIVKAKTSPKTISKPRIAQVINLFDN